MDNIAIQVSHAELSEFVKLFYKTKRPLYIWGGIGIGKSEVIKETAKQIADGLNLKFTEEINEMDNETTFGIYDLRISQLDSTDIKGIPIPIEENGIRKTVWVLPNFLPRNPKSKGIIFCDELNLGVPSVQNSFYQIIHDRRIGDLPLPAGWYVLACGNRQSDRTNVFEMSMALANRFCHVELAAPSAEQWTAWAAKRNIDTRIMSFVNFKPQALYKFEPAARSKSFPTPRTWFFCHELIHGLNPENEEEWEQYTKLTASAIGEGMALEFAAFSRLNQKIDINDILKNPQKIAEIREVDLMYSVISGISEKYRKDSKLFNNILEICKHTKSEYAVLLLHFIRSINPSNWDRQTATLSNKTWNELANKYKNYLLR